MLSTACIVLRPVGVAWRGGGGATCWLVVLCSREPEGMLAVEEVTPCGGWDAHLQRWSLLPDRC
jgi:hypothetical protein